MLNVYKIPETEHPVVDAWAADETSVWETLFWKYSEYVAQILRNYKKLNRTKIVEVNLFFNFKCAIIFSGNCRIIFRKKNMTLMWHFYINFDIELP